MLLALDPHPNPTAVPGEACDIPIDWQKSVAPWSRSHCIKTAFGILLIQELELKDISLFIWKLKIEKPVVLYPVAMRPVIALQFMLYGTVPCRLRGFGEKLVEKGQFEFFYLPAGANEARFEPGDYESLHIEFRPGLLDKLATYHSKIKELVTRFHQSLPGAMPLAAIPASYTTLSIIHNLRTCNKQNGSFLLEIHKYIFELLSEYTAALDTMDDQRSGTSLPYRSNLIRLRNEILAAPNVNRHTLGKLSRQFGIGQAIIKREFGLLFGATLSLFVRQHALARAHQLLTTTRESIDTIAETIGYSGREAFESAFKKQYGQTPFAIRKQLNS